MNYQPFLDMHVLVSDDLIDVLTPIVNVFIVFILILFCVMFHLWRKDKERKERY